MSSPNESLNFSLSNCCNNPVVNWESGEYKIELRLSSESKANLCIEDVNNVSVEEQLYIAIDFLYISTSNKTVDGVEITL